MDNLKTLRLLSFLGACLALIVIGLGAYTRLTDAGLGCPDWPGCYGHLIQNEHSNWSLQAWTEMIHRYIAGSLGLLVLGITFLAIKARKTLPYKIPLFLVGLIICQALLGMWTVTLKLHPTIVMLHLIGGFTTLTLLWLYYLQLRTLSEKQTTTVPTSIKRFLIIALGLLILQIALGGWTSANYAALACLDFPQCQGSWLPQSNFSQALTFLHPIGPNFEFGLFDSATRMTIHMMHRFGALITTVAITLSCGMLLRNGREKINDPFRKATWVVIGLLCFQVSLGITNVLEVLPLGIAVLHNMVAAMLLLSVVTLTYLVMIKGDVCNEKH